MVENTEPGQHDQNLEIVRPEWATFSEYVGIFVDYYKDALLEDAEERRDLSPEARSEFEKHLAGLDIVGGKVQKYAANPSDFVATTTRYEEDHNGEKRTEFGFRVRSKKDSSQLPDDPRNPQNQLNFNVVVTTPLSEESEREIIEAVGTTRAADQALEAVNQERFRGSTIRFQVNTVDVYRDSRGRPNLTPRAGFFIRGKEGLTTTQVTGGKLLGNHPHTMALDQTMYLKDLLPIVEHVRVASTPKHLPSSNPT